MFSSNRLSLLIALSAALVVAGCGGGSSDDSKSGGGSVKVSAETKELFESTCGSCHALSDAGTSGSVGPPLDGMSLDAERVAQQIDQGGGSMPPGLLEGDERDAVAKYVAEASN